MHFSSHVRVYYTGKLRKKWNLSPKNETGFSGQTTFPKKAIKELFEEMHLTLSKADFVTNLCR